MTFEPAKTWNHKLKDLSKDFVGGFYSQQHEAEIIDRIFEICKPRNKWCVDFGAGDGKNLSNTYHFIKNKGWNGVLFEIRVEEFEKLQETHKGNDMVQLFMMMVRPKVVTYNGTFTDGRDIESLLSVYTDAPKDLDFMSIDIDSHDYEIWRGMEEYRPNVICIECNPEEENFDVLGYEPSWSELRGSKWYGGATVGLLNKLAEEKGYYLVCVDVCNAIYIEKKFAKPLLI
jgi:hypothetical protein